MFHATIFNEITPLNISPSLLAPCCDVLQGERFLSVGCNCAVCGLSVCVLCAFKSSHADYPALSVKNIHTLQ